MATSAVQVHPGLTAFTRILSGAKSIAWQRVIAWTVEYGVIALFAIAALPLPQTPALIFFAITEPPVAQIFLAVLLGKMIKYFLLAMLAALFPARFRLRDARPGTSRHRL